LDFFSNLFFSQICSEQVHIVRGDFDDNETYPEEKVIDVGNFKIGLIHGHQLVPFGDQEILKAVQRRLNVDILITGHTHQLHHFSTDGALFLNPGSATGAYSPHIPEVVPSFILLDIDDKVVTPHLYRSVKGELEHEIISVFEKKESNENN